MFSPLGWLGGNVLFACAYDPGLMQFANKRLRAGV
ncbi:hypothetical protein O987_17635 [Comamonas testosteroni TK102]|uniref:Uncharacterized protein n=1 Tax=Comamonas testosteroni TK102 TaxID=1392005 RepID=A0A076PLB5_COMTE|nr:hypothetical protein O987_17635 [Comamonas testosteroni TK102]